ncbi:MAG: peptidase U32 family protein, partial [Bacilli bacterium]
MKKIELLSPAGDKESFISAINNGADAIYIAGTKFGARAYITNFSNEEISELIRYAHGLDVKVYVTVNTLIKNSEIQECLEFVDFLYKNSVDAILIQDIGLACILRNIFPKLPLHASTQMNVMTVGEAKRLKAEGFERIVLARECPIQTIIDIKAQVDIELEVFAHGALCMSYSGNCYMSSLIGKRSGNRGRCAGACRMEYTLTDLTDDIGTKYFLSTKDLCT